MADRVLYIKNMVCDRCVMVVRERLLALGLEVETVELGRALLGRPATDEERAAIRSTLEAVGFELLDDPRSRLVERTRALIIDWTRREERNPSRNLSDFLSDRLHQDYSALSKLFSEETGTTIERYAIAQRIELAKELLSYGERSLGEIADHLGYSSVAHLSNQFKRVVGQTPSAYRRLCQGRKPLDRV